MNVPDDLKAEYKRLRDVRREIGKCASATMSVIEAITLIERITALEAKVERLEPLVDSADDEDGAMMWTSDHKKILERERERLSAPVTDAEWERFCRHDEDGYEFVNRADADALIAARKGAAS